jgi:uncharacterized protein (TIGR00730 family)
MKIGITLTSSLEVGQEYIELTENVARTIAARGYGIVYGGTDYGMMHTLGHAYTAAGGQELIGVMAKDLMAVTKGYVAYDKLNTSYLEETMEDRKRKIVSESDAFVILPGGYGTFEEIGSIVGGKVNKLYDKPIAIINYGGYYDKLITFLSEMQDKQFSKIAPSEVVYVCETIEQALEHFQAYETHELKDKFV